ncbi:hypothetical protein [Streptomyces sp. NBC_00842]|uniref:hypothetical protein n=1 Tax=Streptomyces sp. NBC_00842 TaxID=2975848 RepID=UPI003868198A
MDRAWCDADRAMWPLAALLVAAAAPGGGHPGGSARRTQAARAVAARKWGPAAMPPAAFPDHMEWRERDCALYPGDIILTHFGGRKDWGGSMAPTSPTWSARS